MADTGYLSPGTTANETSVGTKAWGTADNAKISNDSYTSANVGDAEQGGS
jgi:hypothetical protein